MRWFLPFTAWYVLSLALIANFAGEAADGDLAFGVLPLCAVFLLLGWTLWRNWQWSRSTEAAARSAVERVLCERASAGEEIWADRDGHALTAVHRGRLFWAYWALVRTDEDQFDEIAVHGRAPVTFERYMFAAMFPHVPRFIHGTMVTAAREVDHVPDPDPGVLWAVRMTGLAGKGKHAHRFADTAELARLAEQLRAAEPVT